MSKKPVNETVEGPYSGVEPAAPGEAREAPHDLPTGVEERYEIGEEHARGGIGRVFRAHDRRLERTVAIKALASEAAPQSATRFVREALITARLQHPGIVPVYDAGRRADGQPFYAMKLVAGRTLRDALAAAPDLDARLALLPHLLAVAEAVAYAHSEGVVHRDLKPSNVMIGDFGESVVVDWGLARDRRLGDDPAGAEEEGGLYQLSHAQMTHAGAVVGTPAYMPPEQARGELVDERADVYALGAMLYELLAGRPPYQGAPAEVLARVVAEPPPPLGRLVPGAPHDLVAIAEKAMARDPAARYPTARELAADLSRFQAGQLVGAREYGPLALALRWLRRYRLLASLIALVVAVTVVSFQRVRHERAAAQAAAMREKSRADAMILTQAESALVDDPTRALAWLKTYPLDGPEWPRVRALGREAVWRGVARHVLHRAYGHFYQLRARDGGREVLVVDGRSTLVVWNVQDGSRRVVCVPGEIAWLGRDETFGGELATALADGRVLVWDRALTTFEEVAVVPDVVDASLSSDGRWLVAVGEEGPALLVDRRSGAQSTLAAGDLPLVDVAFVPGTERVLLRSASGQAQLYDVAAGEIVLAAAPGVVDTHVSPRGRHVVLVRRPGIEWIDAVTLESRGLAVQLFLFMPIAFFADGRVAVAERTGRTTLVWDPRAGRTRGLPVPAGPVAVAPGGRLVATLGPDMQLWVTDVETGDLRAFRGPARALPRQVELVTDELVAAVGEKGEIRLWDLRQEGVELVRLGQRPFEPAFALARGGRALFLGAEDGSVMVMDLARGGRETLFQLDGPVKRVAASRGGEVVVAISARGTLARFDRRGGALEKPLTGVGVPEALVVSGDGRFAAGVSHHEGSATIWDLQEKTALRLTGLGDSCARLFLSPDDRTLAISCAPEGPRGFLLHDLQGGTSRLLAAPVSGQHLLGFSPSGRYLFAGSIDGRVVRWDVASGALESRRWHSAPPTAGAALSDDVLLTSSVDGLRLSFFSSGVSTVVDASGVLAGSFLALESARFGGHKVDHVRVWDLASGERWSARKPDGLSPAGMTDDGRVVVTGPDGMLRLIAPPGPLAASPTETRAWLDQWTSVKLGDALAPRPVCE